jgi:hypothetical protein
LQRDAALNAGRRQGIKLRALVARIGVRTDKPFRDERIEHRLDRLPRHRLAARHFGGRRLAFNEEIAHDPALRGAYLKIGEQAVSDSGQAEKRLGDLIDGRQHVAFRARVGIIHDKHPVKKTGSLST